MKSNQLLAPTKPTVQKGDLLWKGIVEDLFADFLRFFFADADNKFDMDKGFEFLDKELHEITPVHELRHPRFVDKLVKLWYKDGTEKWLLLHVEVQGYVDNHFPARMFTYFYRIYDKYQQEITSLAIFTDNDDDYQPDRYKYDCIDTSLLFCYKTYKVKAQDTAILEQSDNPFAIVVLMVLNKLQQKGRGGDELVDSSLSLVRRLYKKGFPKDKIGRLLQFIKRYANFEDSALLLKFEEEIREITKNPDHMGIYEQILEMEKEEAKERAELETKAVIVKNLLLESDLDIQKIAHITDVSIDFVIEVKNILSEEGNSSL